MADRQALRIVVELGSWQQDFRRPSAELEDASVVEPGDIVTTVEQSEVTIQPGREAKLTVRIERRNDFKGRIPIEVRGLPHGTRVLDIGLSGILITERDTSRVITLYSEPWAQPTTHPFVVLAKREDKNTEHAAKSIQLRVLPPAALATSGEKQE